MLINYNTLEGGALYKYFILNLTMKIKPWDI